MFFRYNRIKIEIERSFEQIENKCIVKAKHLLKYFFDRGTYFHNYHLFGRDVRITWSNIISSLNKTINKFYLQILYFSNYKITLMNKREFGQITNHVFLINV